jgi:hypothetical protein
VFLEVKQAEQKSKAQATPAEAAPAAASSFSWANHDWSVEIAFLSFLAVFGANYFYGKSANYKMAHAWYAKLFSTFSLFLAITVDGILTYLSFFGIFIRNQ